MTVIPIVIGALGTIPKGLVIRLEDLEIGGQAEVGQNTKKSPVDLRRLVVPQTPLRIVLEIKILPYKEWYMHKLEPSEKMKPLNLSGILTYKRITSKKIRLTIDLNKIKRTRHWTTD